jgi:hypothetical protein
LFLHPKCYIYGMQCSFYPFICKQKNKLQHC